MTLGDKIRTSRKCAKIKKSELAQKLNVSRFLITKWEWGICAPDTETVNRLSVILDVSFDYLLANEEYIESNIIIEPIDLSSYEKERKKKIKDKVVRQKFPEAQIMTLLANKVPSKKERATDNLMGVLTDAPFGTVDVINSIELLGNEFYLVVQNNIQFLVIVADKFIYSYPLSIKVSTVKLSKFQVGNIEYFNCGPILYA